MSTSDSPRLDWLTGLYSRVFNLSSHTILFWISVLILVVIVGIPVAVYLWGSFWSASPGLPGGEFTLRGYQQLTHPLVIESLSNTLIVGVGSTLVSLIIGIIFLMYALKTNGYGASLLAIIVIIQYMLPSYINAFAWIYYLGPRGVVNQALMALPFVNDPVLNIYSLWGIVLVSGTHYAGLVYLLSSGGIKAMPIDLENAAQMYASKFQVMRRIILPLVLPSLTIATVLIVIRNLQSFGIPLILGLPRGIYVLATLMFQEIQSFPPNFTFAAAAGVILLGVTLVGLYVQRSFSGSRDKYETLKGSEEFGQRFDLAELRLPLSVAMWAMIVLLYLAPFATIIVASFQEGFLHPEDLEFTLTNYEQIFLGDWWPSFRNAVTDTIVIALIVGVAGMILSTMCSYVIVKSDHIMGTILDYVTLASSSVPGLIAGIAFLMIFLTYDPLALYGTIWIIILAFMGKYVVYGTRAVNSSFRSIGNELEDAAKVSGSTTIGLFRKVYAPLITPGFVAGFMIYVIDTTKSLSIPLLLSSARTEMIQSLLYRMLGSANPGPTAAVAVLMILGIAFLYGLVHVATDIDVTKL